MQGQAGGDFHRGGVSRPSGWRKATAAVVLAEDLAAEGQGAAIEKGRAVVAVKRVGAHIGLKAADLLLIDTLSAFSRRRIGRRVSARLCGLRMPI